MESTERGPGGVQDAEGPGGAADSGVNRVAAQLRRLTELVVGRRVDEATLGAAADRLAEVAGTLERSAAPGRRPRFAPLPKGRPQDLVPTSPVFGYANPLAPPVEIWEVDGEGGERELRGRVVFGYPYEGPPTCVHGGVIAEVFDELLGAVLIMTGRPGMTGTLTVRYRRPTPLLTPLDLESRRISADGRKMRTWAGIYHDGRLTAEAEGVFVAVRPEDLLRIFAANAEAAGGDVLGSEHEGPADRVARSRPAR